MSDLREQIAEQKRLLLSAFHNWQIGEITSEAYNQYSEKFPDSILKLLDEAVQKIENPCRMTLGKKIRHTPKYDAVEDFRQKVLELIRSK